MRPLAVASLVCGLAASAHAQPAAPNKIDTKAPFAVLDPGGHVGEVRGVAFTQDGKTVVTAAMDRTVRVWDAASGDLIQRNMRISRRRYKSWSTIRICCVISRWET